MERKMLVLNDTVLRTISLIPSHSTVQHALRHNGRHTAEKPYHLPVLARHGLLSPDPFVAPSQISVEGR
jgi:hypothetical protein